MQLWLTFNVEVEGVGHCVALDVANGAGVIPPPAPPHPLQHQRLAAQDDPLLHILLHHNILQYKNNIFHKKSYL